MSNHLNDHHNAYYTYIEMYIQSICILLYVALKGGILVDIKMHLFGYQKVGTRSRSVSVHSDLSYDASHAHKRGRGDNSKN